MRALYAVVLLCLACGPDFGGEQVITLKALGLHLTENPYALDAGALVRANDTTIERTGVVQLRRGFVDVGMTALVGEQAKAGTFYQDKLVFQHGASSLSYLSGSTRTAYSGTFTPPTGRRTRFAQANQNLYFTSSTGPRKLTAYTGTPSAAGGLRPLHMTLSTTGTSGFLTALRSTAYRVVWSSKDVNGNIVTGPPSQYEIVTNSAIASSVAGQVTRAGTTVTVNTAAAHGLSTGNVVYMSSTDVLFPSGDFTVTVTDADTFTFTQSGTAGSSTSAISFAYSGRNVSATAYIPDDVTATSQGYYAEVYRTYDETPDAESVPSDEMGKVYEYYPTNVDITNGYFTFTDSTPDALVGAGLYTNASEEGLTQANDPPPVASDLAYWNGHMFYASTRTVYGLHVSMIATPASGSAFALYRNGVSTAFVAAATEGADQFKIYTTGTVAENVANTAKSLVRAINESAGAYWTAEYVSGPFDAPGSIYLRDRVATTDVSWVRILTDSANKWTPAPISRRGITVDRVANVATASTGAAHGFSVGQQVYVEYDDGGVLTDTLVTIASVPGATSFTYASTGADFAAVLGFVYSRDISDATAAAGGALDTKFNVADDGNRLMYSKYGQPEHVPALNYMDIGAPDDTIRRVVPLRDSLFIFMEKGGLYRVSGQEPFFVDQFDPTVRLLGDENLAVIDNKIVAFTSKGVVAISESGVGQSLSVPIETALLDLQANSLTALKSYGFATAYESAGKFLLWLPDSSDDTNSVQAYVFHLGTGTWTRWTKSAYFGLVHPSEDLLYVSRGTTISKERKARANADYQDEGGAAISGDVQWAPFTGGDPGTMKQFQEVQFLLTGASVTGLTAYFSTDQSTTETAVVITPTVSPATKGAVRCLVPLEKQRGGELNVRLVHATASENPSIAGMKVLFKETGSPNVNR